MASKRPSMRERVKEAAAKQASGGAAYIKIPDGAKAKFFQPKAEEYELDCLPYEVTIKNHPEGLNPGDLWYKKDIKVHYNIGAEEKSYICPRTIGLPCPICEAHKVLAKDPSATDEEVKALVPKDRVIFQVIDLKDDSGTIQLFEYSHHLFNKKLLLEINKTENGAGSTRRRKTVHAGFADLEDGQTLIASFQEKSMGKNKFFECDRIDADDRDAYGEEILDETLDLDSIIEIHPYEKLEAIFLAIADSGKEKEEEKPAGRRRGAEAKEEDPEPTKEENTGRRRGRGAEKEEADPPKEEGRRRRGAAEPEEKKEEAPAGRRGRGAAKEEEKKEDPAPSGRRTRGAAKEENPCPHGLKFGEDHETQDCCIDTCPEETWEKCKACHEGK